MSVRWFDRVTTSTMPLSRSWSISGVAATRALQTLERRERQGQAEFWSWWLHLKAWEWRKGRISWRTKKPPGWRHRNPDQGGGNQVVRGIGRGDPGKRGICKSALWTSEQEIEHIEFSGHWQPISGRCQTVLHLWFANAQSICGLYCGLEKRNSVYFQRQLIRNNNIVHAPDEKTYVEIPSTGD